MKILQIYELGPLDEVNVHSGIDVAILELSKHLSRMGHEVSILCGAGNGVIGKHYVGDVEIIPVEFSGIMRRTWSPSNLRFIRQAAFPFVVQAKKLDKFDIYHGHVYASGLLANYLARRSRGKAVNTIHGSYYPIWNEIASPLEAGFYGNCERILAPLLARMSNLQIHTAGYFAKQVLEWGAPKEKIRVIHNGVDSDVFHPSVKAVEFDKDAPVIFTARRLVRKNGVEYLVRAMKHVLRKEDCSLLIAGDGPERSRLEGLASKLGISSRIIFLGLLQHREIPSYLALADVAVVPSLIEASSLFILEAMAMDKPLVATKVGAIPEIAAGALLVEPKDEVALADGILQALKDGFDGYAKVQCTWEDVARQTEDCYFNIM
ncbi:MAG: glycosyltransferase family 4 protein [Candidatus Hydrothermarchaeales archaeon]